MYISLSDHPKDPVPDDEASNGADRVPTQSSEARHRREGVVGRRRPRHRQPAHRHLLGVGLGGPAALHHRRARAVHRRVRLHRRHLPGRQRPGADRRRLGGRPGRPTEVGRVRRVRASPRSPGSALLFATVSPRSPPCSPSTGSARGCAPPRATRSIAASSRPGEPRALLRRAPDAGHVGAALGPLIAFADPAGRSRAATRRVFVVSFAFAVLGVAVLGILRARQPASARERAGAGAPRRRSAGGDLTDPRLRRLLVAAGAARAAHGRRRLHLPGRCSSRDAFAAQWFPLLYVGTNIAYLALAIPMGRLADRIGRRQGLRRRSPRPARRPTCRRAAARRHRASPC